MCYNISNTERKLERLEKHYSKEARYPELYEPFYNLSGFSHPAVQGLSQGDPDILPMQWGIVEPDVVHIEAYWRTWGGRCLNTQSEWVFKNKRTKTAIRENRCVIPVTGFFEPHHKGNDNYPRYIQSADNSFLSLLGCYTPYDDMNLFTILTAPANPFLAEIHNVKKRMPIMCPLDLVEDWLDNSLNELQIKEIMYTDTDQDLSAYPVSKDALNTRKNSNKVEILQKVDPEG